MAIKKAKISGIIFQSIPHNEDKFFKGKFDLVNEHILQFADANQLSVYLGLLFDDDW